MIGFSGCIGALRENTCCLALYSTIIGVVLLAEISVLAALFMSRDWLTQEVFARLDETVIVSYYALVFEANILFFLNLRASFLILLLSKCFWKTFDELSSQSSHCFQKTAGHLFWVLYSWLIFRLFYTEKTLTFKPLSTGCRCHSSAAACAHLRIGKEIFISISPLKLFILLKQVVCRFLAVSIRHKVKMVQWMWTVATEPGVLEGLVFKLFTAYFLQWQLKINQSLATAFFFILF